jgi:hypothetical protein
MSSRDVTPLLARHRTKRGQKVESPAGRDGGLLTCQAGIYGTGGGRAGGATSILDRITRGRAADAIHARVANNSLWSAAARRWSIPS